MEKSNIVKIIICLVFIIGFITNLTIESTAKEEQKPINFKVVGMFGPGNLTNETMPWLLNEASKKSGIPIKIETYWLETFAKATEHLPACRTGLCDVTTLAAAYWPGDIPLTQIPNNLPCTTSSNRVSTRATIDFYDWKPARDEMEIRNNVKFIAAGFYGPLHIFGKPVKRLEDLKGYRLRAWGLTARAYKKAGVIPIFVSAAEGFDALQKGTLDGVSANVVASGKSLGYHEIVPAINLLHNGAQHLITIINLDKWNSLPPVFQKALYEIGHSDAMIEYWVTQYGKEEREYLEMVRKVKPNVKIIYPDPGEQGRLFQYGREVWEELKDEYRKKGMSQQIEALELYVSLIKKYEVKYGK
jgi:TRAP-type C4-dicarboxylate transport system substrate-binding protein